MTKVDKFIVFKIGDCLMALPMSDVLKVVNCPPSSSGSLRSMGFVQLGNHTIRVLDLHQQLNSGDLPTVCDRQSFLVITRTPDRELCGIVVDEPPNLVELSSDGVRSLPPPDHQSGFLPMVSHTAIISHDDVTTTILLLDVKRLLNPVRVS